MKLRLAMFAALLAAIAGTPAQAEETPKRGGILTYMIPADAPPSLDAHRESTYATMHAVAPFYSVLIRANPQNTSIVLHAHPAMGICGRGEQSRGEKPRG